MKPERLALILNTASKFFRDKKINGNEHNINKFCEISIILHSFALWLFGNDFSEGVVVAVNPS